MDYKMYYLALRHPSVEPKDWPKHWRTHPKFVSQFPSIGGRIASINYTARVYEPVVDGAPVDLPQVNTKYDGVAVVSSPNDTLAVRQTPSDIEHHVLEDERRVFGDLTRHSASFGKEVLVLGGAPNKAAVIRFMRRRPGTSAEDFNAAWSGLADAAKAAVDAGKIHRYVHVEQSDPRQDAHRYDGISEAWFTSPEEAARALKDPELAPLFDAEGKFSDPDESVTMITENIYSWPRV